jgi:hypothetical protein
MQNKIRDLQRGKFAYLLISIERGTSKEWRRSPPLKNGKYFYKFLEERFVRIKIRNSHLIFSRTNLAFLVKNGLTSLCEF